MNWYIYIWKTIIIKLKYYLWKEEILFMKNKVKFQISDTYILEINDRLLSSVRYISVTVQLTISIGQSIVQVTISRRFHKSSVQL